jgi:hypothetical protein
MILIMNRGKAAAHFVPRYYVAMEWKLINTVPLNSVVELAIIDNEGTRVLAFPCRRTMLGWIDAETNKRVYYIRPTHWRDWSLSGTAH